MCNDPLTIEITVKEYDRLKQARDILNALREAGVDNWEGYGEAMQQYYTTHPEEQ